jgi:crotonobetainyl-CoA:carnitine CoA-transferase CaiB-like acyl-CoA transferase
MLNEIRVLSFTHFLQGPSACQLLADLGAEVIKIEPPVGAFERSWSGPDAYLDSESVFFLLGNRNVRSMTVDLKSAEGREVIDRLVATADVLVESFRPGAMDRLGLGYGRLREIRPELVYCSLSGYGSSGPYADRPGQDLLVQSISGLAWATGTEAQGPTPVGASVVDQHGAVLGAFGVLAALHGRNRTGRGMRVESNLLNAALDLQVEPLGYFLNGFHGARSREGISSRFYKAPYGVFRTRDGELVSMSLNSLPALARAFDDPWLAEVKNAYDQREQVNARLVGHLSRLDLADASEKLQRHDLWWAPVNGYERVVEDAQVQHNGSFAEFNHPRAGRVKLLGHPLVYDGDRPSVRSAPPDLGADTRAILETLGYEADRISEMTRDGGPCGVA